MTGIDTQLAADVARFYGREARLLDEGRFREWADTLAEDLSYKVPVRAAAETRKDEVQAGAYRVNDSKKMVLSRIERLETGIAFAETPPSRTVRMVSSLYIEAEEGDAVSVTTAILCYRQRGIDEAFELIPARRNDTLRRTENGLELVERTVLTGETVLQTPNLGIFL